MSTCVVSGLPITEKPHWKANHAQSGYTTKFSLIHPDILHGEILTDRNVHMDYIEISVFQEVISESKLAGKAIYMLFGLKNVKGISLAYKKNLVNILYNSGPTFKLLVVYDVDQEIRSIVETFAAIAPEESKVVIAHNYQDAIRLILDTKSGKHGPEAPGSSEKDSYDTYKKEFLSALARFNWLNLLDHPITLPPETSPLFPYFKGLEAFQQDLREKEALHREEQQKVRDEYEKRVTEKNILLNAQEALNKKAKLLYEQEKAMLANRMLSKDLALKRLSTAIAAKRSKIKIIHDLAEQIDREPEAKTTIISLCKELADHYHRNETYPDQEVSAADSTFIANLQRKHPALSKKDQRLCLLIHQNHNTSEIATATGLTVRGIESARYRLHKKLGLSKHESIKHYLHSLIEG